MLTASNSSVIYVSQKDGDDSYSGFSPVVKDGGEGPVKTLGRLYELINQIRENDKSYPLTVRFMGDYELMESIHLEDNKDITFESYGENKARIIGGKILKGFRNDTFNGAPCLSLYIPEVEKGEWHFTDLFVNGAPAKLSRYPKNGTLKAVTTENPDNWALTNSSKWFIAFKEDLANISGVEDAIVSFNHFWIDEHSPVESYDPETGKLVLKYRSRFMLTVNYEKNSHSDLHYYLENVAETFGAAGEWFLDVKRGMLYYVPKEGETEETIEVIAPTVKHFAEIFGTKDNKAEGIRFRNLEFIATKGDYKSRSKYIFDDNAEEIYYASDVQSCFAAHGAIRFENAEACCIENCNILCSGVHAVEINKGCQHIRVEGCNILNCGAGGVKIFGTAARGDEDIRPTGSCIIKGNTIKNCGLRYAAGCGVLVGHSAHNEISENEIAHLEYSGISVGWVWGYAPSSTYGNVIKNNHVHHIGQGRLSDMGGIYLLGIQHGTVVSGNVVHDVISSNYGGMGIYTDEGSSYITVENNIVFRCKDSCYQHHYGKNNTIRGNVFAFAGKGLMLISKEEDHVPLMVQENTFITDGSPIYITGYSGDPNKNLIASDNRFWSTADTSPVIFGKRDGSQSISLKEWQEMGYDSESVIQKPCDSILNKVNE